MAFLLYLQRLIPIFGVLMNRLRFPRLRTGLRVEIVSTGKLVHGAGVSLGEGTRVDVFPKGNLVIGEAVSVGRNAYFWVDPGARLSVGDGTGIQDNCRFYGNVVIGRGCIFAPNVFIASGTHSVDNIPYRTIIDQDKSAPSPHLPVRIFDDCWFGINAVVTPGVTIGRGCVVGANSVVTADLPPYSVAGGNPARVLRTRLKFTPKARIEAGCEEDQPYFYDGFAASSDQASRVADSEFILALERSNARGVRLCLTGEPGEITHSRERKSIPGAEGIVEFALSNEDSPPFFKFCTTARCQIHWAELL